MTTFSKAGFVLLVLGGGLAALGLAVGGPFVGAAVAVFGVAAIVGGVHSVVTRRHRTGRDHTSALDREHTGAPAVIFGLTFVATGVVLAVAGSAAVVGLADGLWSLVTERPGPVAMAVGAWICLLGVATMISRWTYVHASTVWWQRLPGMAVGLLVVAMGIALIGIGRSLASDPPASDEVVERVLDTLAGWLGGN